MRLDSVPLFSRLEARRSILVAGAGGGFDVFAGLPLAFALRRAGKAVHLANVSFSHLAMVTTGRIAPGLVEVRGDADGPTAYFPEKYLSQWFASRGDDVPIYAFERSGVRPLVDAYRVLCGRLAIDAVVLVDGGTDSLMRGDEAGLGTPVEDVASIVAVDELDAPEKILVSIGFGVDAFHGVCHAHVLEAIAELTRAGGSLGAFSLLPAMEEYALYKDAIDFVFRAMPEHPSIVNASIASAVEGAYGDVHSVERTRGSTLYINPLMAMYFAFDLRAVAERLLYREDARLTRTTFELSAVIEAFQREHGALRAWERIPV